MMKAKCATALILFTHQAIGQQVQTLPMRNVGTQSPAENIPGKTSYLGGQLRIHAIDSTMAEVLKQVGTLIGVTIDIPAGTNTEPMPVVDLGPGPAREVLAALLSDSNLDFLIQASNSDPNRIQNVMLMTRDKKGGPSISAEVQARSTRSPFARGGGSLPKPEEPTVSEVSTALEDAAQQAASVTPEAPAAQPEPPPQPPAIQPDPASLSRPDQLNSLRPGAMTPPAVLNPQSINQQLQQMYQQRMQMVQQGQTTPSQPGSK